MIYFDRIEVVNMLAIGSGTNNIYSGRPKKQAYQKRRSNL